MIRVVFFGTPEFSVGFLAALAADKEVDVVAVVSQPDRPSGRGHELKATPVRAAAERAGIETYQPPTLKSEKAAERLRSYGADVFVVVAYGKLIPPSVLSIPRLGCVNVHPSLLPKYRGPSPMQFAIANGDAATGVTIMLLDEGMDTGPILNTEKIDIGPRETYSSLTQKAQRVGVPLLIATLKQYVAGQIAPKPQTNGDVKITRLLERDEGRIDWGLSSEEIDRKIRAYNPWPGSWGFVYRNGESIRLKILTGDPGKPMQKERDPGRITIKDDRVYVNCAEGSLELTRIQPEGKQPMDEAAFARGYSDLDGATFALVLNP